VTVEFGIVGAVGLFMNFLAMMLVLPALLTLREQWLIKRNKDLKAAWALHGLHDRLEHSKVFQKLFGPASLQLAADKKGICHQLPPIDYEVGVIAGDRTFGLFLWLLLDKPNDGKVTVESTKVEGMQDFIVLPVSHPFFPYNKQVKRKVAEFLKWGKF